MKPSDRTRDQWVQQCLQKLVAPGLTADGAFGPRSHAALKDFQRRVHEFVPNSPALAVDGMVGPATLAALAAATGTHIPGADEPAPRLHTAAVAREPEPAPPAGAETFVERRVSVRVYQTIARDSALLVPVPAASPGPKRLHVLAAAALTRMAAAVQADLGIELKVASAWRAHRWDSREQYEAVLLAKYGSLAEGRRWLAFDSPHETGLAIDIGVGGLEPSRASVASQRQQPLHRWLVARAWEFGWHPYKVEPWHWEFPMSLAAYRSGTVSADDPGPPPSAVSFGEEDEDDLVLEDIDLDEDTEPA